MARVSYTEEDARRDLPTLLGAAGLDESLADEAELLHYNQNGLFRIPSLGIVMRNVRPNPLAARRAKRVAKLGEYFRQSSAPTVRLADGFTQPINVGDLWATIWNEEERRPKDQIKGRHMGSALKAFHEIDISVSELAALPRWQNPLADSKSRIRQGFSKELITKEEYEKLIVLMDELERDIKIVRPQLEKMLTLLHGDPQIANLLFRDDEPIWCDFDSTMIGPSQADLAVTAVNAIHFNKPERHTQAAAAYGQDVMQDENWDLFRRMREAKLIASNILNLKDHPAIRPEFEKRYRSVFEEGNEIWIPYTEAKENYDSENPGWLNQQASTQTAAKVTADATKRSRPDRRQPRNPRPG